MLTCCHSGAQQCTGRTRATEGTDVTRFQSSGAKAKIREHYIPTERYKEAMEIHLKSTEYEDEYSARDEIELENVNLDSDSSEQLSEEEENRENQDDE